MPVEWSEHAMWWHVYPLGFTGAPIRGPRSDDAVHRLGRIESWLDHVIGLGLNGLVLGPVFRSSTHGYDTVDHFTVDPRLGDQHDFDRLVASAHERGIRIVLDGVFNHVGREHPLFRQTLENGPGPAPDRYFKVDWEAEDPASSVAVFEGHDALVQLDHASVSVASLVERVMDHWLSLGVDGWRLDAAYAVPQGFWATVIPAVRRRHPDAWFLGEVIHGNYSEFVTEGQMDSVTQYELWQGIWHSISDRNLFELKHALLRHNDLLERFAPYTFVGNHDVTRIASAVGPDFVPHALAVLFTAGGSPAVYAGDEYGWEALKEARLGGDDAVRPEFPPEPPDSASLPEASRRILACHADLIGIRRCNPWLHRARTDVVHVENLSITLRAGSGEGALVTALNLSEQPAHLPSAGASRVIAGAATAQGSNLTLPPRGWAVLQGSGS